ncbi:hypothetical protein [Pontibacter rugosus]|uniref:Uncharacterized protein n=1 Tax=Pontibacter rugosus TaxID=1745966 RepID=A0ABW3SLL4_9BACT
MKNYLLLSLSFMLLLFALPKNSSMRSFAEQAALKKDCTYSKRFGKRPCIRKCLKHQTHSRQQNSASGVASDCSQQVYALVNTLHEMPVVFFTAKPSVVLPQLRKHLPPVLENDPEPPRLS